ncbi:MAG: hypothetical protein R6U20_10760 [Longimonas sp.]
MRDRISAAHGMYFVSQPSSSTEHAELVAGGSDSPSYPPAPVADHKAPTVVVPDTTQQWSDDAGVPIYRSANVQFSYLFYPEAHGNRNGVVVQGQVNREN